MSKCSFKYFKKNINVDIAQIFTCISLAYTVTLSPCYAQQIITDGNTQTNLNTSGNTTTVTTQTIKGTNAFNSFSRFNVDSGKTVNLVVPSNTNNLINVVTSETTNINGILNSIKDNHIGGNVFLLNPHGIIIGNQGVVNVGSLTAITTTQSFTDKFFDSPNNPNNASVVSVLNGTVPINNSAAVTNNGKINAISDVKINAGSVTNTGDIYSGAVFQENNITIGDVVNINTLENGANIVNNGGNITINANSSSNVVLSGLISNPNGTVTITNTGGSILDGNPNSESANIIAKNITMTAGGTIGTSTDDLNIDTGSTITSLLTATTSNQLINIKEMTGDLYLFTINSGYGDITLTSAGSILEGSLISNGNTLNGFTVGNNTIIKSLGGTIGNSTTPLIVFSGLTSNSTFSAVTSNQSINLDARNSGQLYTNGVTYNLTGNLNVKNINAGTGDVILKSSGNILDGNSADETANITGKNITLTPYGTIATSTDDLNIDSGSASNAVLTATTINKLINIKETSGDLFINSVNAGTGDVRISSAGSILDGNSSNENANVIGNNIILSSNSGTIGSVADNLNIDSGSNINGTLSASARAIKDTNINIKENSGDLYVKTVDSGSQMLILESAGSILDGNPQEYANVSGSHLTLIAGENGTIGSLSDDLNIAYDLNVKGQITATTRNKLINLNLINDNIYVKKIDAGTGDVILTAKGSILDGNNIKPEEPNIIGKNITLTAGGTGTIGTLSDDININTGSTTSGVLTATTTNQLINIKETTGDLYVNSINAGTGDVILTSAGSILDGNTTTPEVANITAKNITLTAGGTIGTLTDDLNIDTGSTTSGVLTATTTNQSINIKEMFGDLYVKSVNAGMGDVKLVSAIGIRDYDTSSYYIPKIMGNNITLIADSGTIGDNTAALPIDTGSTIYGTLTAITSNQLIRIYEITDDLYLKRLDTGNDSNAHIELFSAGSLLNGNISNPNVTNVKAERITLIAGGLGTIGTISDALNIDSGESFTFYAIGNFINLNETNGDLHIYYINSHNGNLILTSAGSILDSNAAYANIVGNYISLKAMNGTLGSIAKNLNINPSTTNKVILTATTSNQLINIKEMTGDLYVNSVNAGTGDVILASAGSILDGNTLNENPNITAKNITLTAVNGSIGTIPDDLNVLVSGGNLNAEALNGSINIAQGSGNLALNNITAYYNVNLAASNVSIDGTIQALADTTNTLLINADGTVNPLSNFGAIISDGNINVNDITTSDKAGSNISINYSGGLSGNGSIKTAGTSAQINITNNSPLNLITNQLTSNNSGQPGTIIVNGDNKTTNFASSNGTIHIARETGDPNINGINITSTDPNANVTIAGNTTSVAGNINVNSANFAFIKDDSIVNAGNDLYLTSNNDASILGNANVNALGNIILTSTHAHASIYGDAVVYSGQDVILNSPNLHSAIHGNSKVYAGRDITLTANNNATFYGNAQVSATGNINLISLVQDAYINSATANAGNDLNMVGVNAYIYLSPNITSGNDINLIGTKDAFIATSTVNAGDNLKLTSGNNSNIYDSAVISAGQNIELYSDNNSNIANSTTYSANDTLILSNNPAFVYNSNATTGGNLVISSDNVSYINGNSIINSNGNVILNGAYDVTIFNSAEVNALGSVILTSANGNTGIFDDTKVNTGLDLLLNSNSLHAFIAGNSKVYAGRDITLTANNNATFYGNAQVSATGNINLISLVQDAYINGAVVYAGKNINLTGNNSYIYQSSMIQSGKDINLTGKQNAFIAASNVTSGQNLKLVSSNDATIYDGADISAGKNIQIYGDNNSYIANSTVKSTKDTIISSKNTASAYNANITTGRNLNLSSDNVSFINGTSLINANSNIALTGINDVYINNFAEVNAHGNIKLTSTNANTNIYGDAVVYAGQDVILNSISLHAAIAGNAKVNAGRNITVTANIHAGFSGDTKLIAGNNINVTANQDAYIIGTTINAGKSINLSGGNNAYIGGAALVNAGNEIKLSAGNDAFINNSANIMAAGNISLKALKNIYIFDSPVISTLKSLSLKAGNQVLISGSPTISAGKIIIQENK